MEKTKDDIWEMFLNNLSHEIRTPLTSIVGFSNLMAELELDDEAKLYLNNIILSATRLHNTVESIMDFNLIKEEEHKPTFTYFSVYEVIQQLLNVLEPKAHEKILKYIPSLKMCP